MNLLRAFSLALLSTAVVSSAIAQDAVDVEDPYLWLEGVEDEKALEWVRARNKEGQTALEAVPEFSAMYEEAKTILTSDARIPSGQVHHGAVYNFWQDDNNKRGLWRRASVESYKSGAPEWETVIDYDKPVSYTHLTLPTICSV